MLQFSIYQIIGYSCLVPFIFAFIISLRQYLKTKYKYLLYLTLAWLSYIFWAFFHTTGTLVMIPALHLYLGCWALMPAAIFVVMFGETISSDTVDTKKIILVSGISALFVYSSYDVSKFGYWQYNAIWDFYGLYGGSELYAFTLFGITLIGNVGLFFYLLRLHVKAPNNLKGSTKYLVVAAILLGPLGPVLFAYFNTFVPGIMFIPFSLGVLITSIIFTRQPKVAFILPFKALRLTVFKIEGGINLYTYDWESEKSLIDEDLFAAMIDGVSSLLRDSIQSGEIREVKMEKAVLIIQKSKNFNIAHVIIATHSSKALREGLISFAKKFEEEFSNYIDQAHEVSRFSSANELVAHYFSFLP